MSSVISILRSLYGSILLRITIVLLALVCLAYYALLLPWLNRAISENYQQQTGHQLQHDKLDIQLFNCNLNLNRLQDSANLWQAATLHINVACWQSLRQRSLQINEIAIGKLIINPQQLENGRWNFEDVQQHQLAANKKTAAKKSTDTAIPVAIKKITLVDSAINSNLMALNNMPLAIAPLNITVSNIDLRKPQAAKLSLSATVNQSVPLTVSGTLDVLALTGELDIAAHNIPLLWFNSAIKPYVALDVLSGTLESRNHILLKAGVPQQLIAAGKLTDLKLRPTSLEQDAVKWKSLEWENLEVLFSEKAIHLPLLTLNELDGQFIIAKDRTTNLQAMIIKPAAVAPASEQALAKPDPAAGKLDPIAGKPEQLAAGHQPLGEAAANTSQTGEKPWQFKLDRLAVNNAAIGFNDQSLVPSFTVIVQQFSGEISGISSDPEQIAQFQLAGNVDGYAPVSLDGKARLFIAQPQLEARFSFKQLDMGALSPYSAEYAGWRIKKGLLTVNLDYHYEQGKIVGKNHVVMDHLEFGEKVRSLRMIDLPLRLALSLLTDEKGIAVLDAEIAGEPSDPSFNIRETLWRALRNTLKKIATAPFRLLSNLLNTQEDLGRIEFTPGEYQLGEQAITKIKLLKEALSKRPAMRLNIAGHYDQKADLLALQQEQVNSALQKNGLPLAAIKAKNMAWANALGAIYQSRGLLHNEASAEQKNQELAALEVVDAERFNRLAHERAQAVKQYFVMQLAIPSEALLLDSETRCEKAGLCSGSEVVFTLED